MEIRPWPSRAASQDLSKATPFVLGGLAVDPPTRQVTRNKQVAVLEPRVMRVLVALAGCGGKVLSRDDLIALCWDGQIVGDGAIDRVISRLRAIFTELADDAVKLETITKVGFRLVVDPSTSGQETTPGQRHPVSVDIDPRPARAGLSRRNAVLLAAGAVVLTGVGGWSAYRSVRGHTVNPVALDLWRRGQLLQKNAEPGGMRQAMSFYKQALAIDPQYADAWGALAAGYQHSLQGLSGEDQAAYPQLLDSAARRALALDPDQPDAATALVLARTRFGRWSASEADFRSLLESHPGYWYAQAKFGIFLREVGRVRESIVHTRRTLTIDPMLPIGWQFLARAHFMAGDLQQADLALDSAARRWPSHGSLWLARMDILLGSGRFGEAAAFARDPRSMPDYFHNDFSDPFVRLAEGLAAEDPVQMARSTDRTIVASAGDPLSAPMFAPLLSILGAPDAALQALDRFFALAVRKPKLVVSPAAAVLFAPPILTLRSDPRFGTLLQRSGLEDYWHRSGSQPDFRRN